MKKTNAFISMIALSLLITFLAGCRNLSNYADDAARQADDVVRNLGRRSGDKTDDVGRGLGTQTDNISSQSSKYVDEVLNFTKEQVKKCAKDVGKSVARESIETAISSGSSQISLNFLFNESKKAIGECAVVKVGVAVHDALLNESANSAVREVAQEYQGQIGFTN